MAILKHIFLPILLISLVFQSCKIGTTGTKKDENIDPEIKKAIQALDKKLVEAVHTANADLLTSIMSDELKEKSSQELDQIVDRASAGSLTAEYSLLNQYYLENSNKGINSRIMSGTDERNDYIIHFKALNEEMFISLLIPETESSTPLITAIYGKYPEGWKLNILQFGTYKLYGHTAPEFYAKAQFEYEKGHLIDAANNMFLGSKIVNPANNNWQYQQEEEMKQFFKTLMGEINTQYKFPISLEGIETKPQIVNIYPQEVQEGYFPMVGYLTKIDLKDTTQTKIENDQIHQVIGEIFKGIDLDKRFIFYKAYNEMPRADKPVPSYGFAKELTK